MAVFGLQLNDLVIIIKGFLELVSEEVAFGALMNIACFVVC